jgi:hypothetical protein
MMSKPQTFQGDLANLPPALLPLTEQDRWLVWRWELRTNTRGKQKWTKPPYQALAPSLHAKSDDPGTWSSHGAAVMVVKRGQAEGIGFALMGSGIGAVDLDHCVNGDSNIEPWAEQLHAEDGGAYKETTVSGGGLRFIGTAEGEDLQRKFTFNRKTGAGIELYRNTNRYITISGLERGTCPALPPLDGLIDTLFSRYGGKAKQSGGFDFNDASPQDTQSYDDLIRNGAPDGQRSEAFQSVVWHLAGRGWTVEAIVDELAQHPAGIGAKYADRLFEEVTRSYGKRRTRKRRTAGCDEGTAGAPWPQIFITPGELPRVTDEAEAALLGLKREIYQRGGQIVRPVLNRLAASDDRETQGWQLVAVTRPHLVEALTCAARFLKFDRRAKGWIPTDAPDKVAETYLARRGAWNLPPLTGVTGTPFLRTDGSICEAPGYDAASGLLYKPECEFPPVPSRPSKDDAQEALELIEGLARRLPVCRVSGPRCGSVSDFDDARSSHHADSAATRLHGAGGWHRQVEAGRYRRRARHRAHCASDRPGQHRRRTRKAPRRQASYRRRGDLDRQLRAPATERLPVPGVDAEDRFDPAARIQLQRRNTDGLDHILYRQQSGHCRRPYPAHLAVLARRQMRTPGTAGIRRGRGRRRQGPARRARHSGADGAEGLAPVRRRGRQAARLVRDMVASNPRRPAVARP